MPFGEYDDFDACVRENSDKRDPEAYCAAIKRQIEGADALSESDREAIRASDVIDDRILDDGPCWDGYTMVGMKEENGRMVPNCVPDDDVPDANLAAADDRCGPGAVKIGDRCVQIERTEDVPPSALSLSSKPAWARRLGEFEEGDAVMWDWQGETVHGRVREVNEEQATVSGDVTIEGDPDDEEPVYIIDEFDDDAGGFRRGNVAKPEASLDESTRDLPDRDDDAFLGAADAPRVMARGSLDTEPIEREELSDGTVAYRNLKLVDAGVWTDQNSQTPTLYDERTFENTVPDYDERRHEGPPVNIAHDIHKAGPDRGEPHEASVGGHIDPESIRTDGKALFGDVILNTDDPAGAFADENLRSALENDGTAGFSPSVELMPTDLRRASDSRAEEHVAAAELTGLGLVRDPASKSVDLRQETQQRAVAMAAAGASGGTDKARVVQRRLMSPEEVRETLEAYGIDVGDMSDEDVMDMAEDLHDDLMDELMPEDEMDGEGEGEESEMAEHGAGMDDDENDEDDKEMMMDDEVLDFIQEELDDLWSTVDDLKEEMATESEMSELAAADTVSELKDARDELDRRLSKLEDKEEGRKTLADVAGDTNDGDDFDPVYDDEPAAPSGW